MSPRPPRRPRCGACSVAAEGGHSQSARCYIGLAGKTIETAKIVASGAGAAALACLSLLVALGYLVYKLVHWQEFQVGMAPLVIGLFFFISVQLFFIGILGEYIGSIHTQVLKRPLVVEKERINF